MDFMTLFLKFSIKLISIVGNNLLILLTIHIYTRSKEIKIKLRWSKNEQRLLNNLMIFIRIIVTPYFLISFQHNQFITGASINELALSALNEYI
jgi:hypothetical protein